MKRSLWAASAMLMLAACGQTSAPAPASEEAPAPAQTLALTCEAFADITGETLAARYGAENLADQTIPGPEGMTYQATVLYPNDPTRRVEIAWRDHATKAAVAHVNVSDEGSVWIGPHELAIGDQLADVERANGRPFQLWGFGWDYGGWVSDWKGGAFTGACNVRARFSPRVEGAGANGDAAFMSDDAAVRANDAVVSEFGLMFAPMNQ